MTAGASQVSSYTPRTELLEMFDGDAEFVDDLVAQFTAQCVVALHDIREAMRTHDAVGVSRAAHAFKGTVGYFDIGTQAVLEAIERNPPADTVRLPSLVAALELHVGRLTRHLRAEFRLSAGSDSLQ